MFDNCTMFMSSGPHLEVTIKLEEATGVFAHINNQVVEGDTMPVTIAKVKTAIDDGVLRPLVAGFTNPELAAGLLDVYGLHDKDEVDIDAFTKQMSNSDLASSLSLEIMDELSDRKGIIDGVDEDIREEIRGAIGDIIITGLNDQ